MPIPLIWRVLASLSGIPRTLPGTPEIRRHIDHLYQTGLGSRSVARHLTTLRNFYGFLLREGQITTDPTEHLRTPRQWQTIPKYLNLEEIEKIIQAPDLAKPTGLRDRAMMELLYASGLRVTELCRVGVGDLEPGYWASCAPRARATSSAWCRWERRPSWRSRRTGSGRPALLKGRASRYLFITARGGCMTRQAFWKLLAGIRQESRHFPRADAPRAASQLRHPPPRGWRRSAQRADHAGACRYLDHPDLYPCHAVETSGHG